ncbi:MAG: GH39 family glycosyl hydrolase [Candidatus Hermodarchaeia archaeon]
MNHMAKITVSVDAGKWLGTLRRMWQYIGYDEINYTTTPSGKATLERFKQLGETPYYVRAHHLLCTGNLRGIPKWGSTNVYTEDGEGNPIYNWRYIDNVFDTYLRYNCKPFVELGFMPLDLADVRGQPRARPWGHWWYNGWSSPPKDYQKWYELVYNLMKHCVDRYGSEEVKTWYWELWNEPDIGTYYWSGTVEAYCKLYDYTAAAVETVLPEAKIGGPATTYRGHDWLDQFLDHCVNGVNHFTGKTGTRLDFISFHAKGAGYRPRWGRSDVEKQLPSVKRLLLQVMTGLDVIDKYPSLKGVPCVLSECDTDGMAAYGVGDNPNLNFRNTEYYPSYVVAAFKKLMDVAERCGREVDALTWAFTFHGERCFEGTRTFTTNGIDKPILNLFRMYASLGNTRLHLDSSGAKDSQSNEGEDSTGEEPDIDGIATMSGNKTVMVLLYCHHDDWDVKGEYDVEVEVDNLPFEGPRVALTHYRIDQCHSNAYTEWVRQGRPSYPTAAQTRVIKSREGLEFFQPKTEVPLLDGKFKKTITLPVHGISLLSISQTS